MSKVKRKNHTSDFKAKVAIEAIRGVQMVNEIGQERGVHPTQVGLWKKSLQEQASTLFDGKRGPKRADPSSTPEFVMARMPECRERMASSEKPSCFVSPPA